MAEAAGLTLGFGAGANRIIGRLARAGCSGSGRNVTTEAVRASGYYLCLLPTPFTSFLEYVASWQEGTHILPVCSIYEVLTQ